MKKIFNLLLFGLLFATITILSACSDNDSKGVSTTTDSNEANGANEQTDGEKRFIVGRGQDAISLDVAKMTDADSFYVSLQVYDRLVNYEEGTANIEPSLATDWEPNEDATEWTFYLRDDVKFHDGNDFTADDVVYNFDRWGSVNEYPFYGSMFGASEDNPKGIVSKVEATGDYEVKVTLSEASAVFPMILAITAFSIASPEAIEKHGDDFFRNPVGTGPFVFKEWKSEESITLTKNEDYFGEPPSFDELVFRVIPDNNSRFMELQAGTIDLMDGLNSEDIPKAENSDDLQIFERTPMNVGYMGLNMKKEPLSNKKVREAINLAIDKDTLMTLFEGLGEKAKSPVPPIFDSFNDDIEEFDYDVEKAKSLLEEAGYPDGLDLSLYIFNGPRLYMPQPKLTAQAIQEMLKDVNINVSIHENDMSTHVSHIEAGEHDMAYLGMANGDVSSYFDFQLQKGAPSNVAFIENAEMDKAIADAKKELDPEKQKELYRRAQAIFHDEIPWVTFANVTAVMVGKKGIVDYVPHPLGSEPFNKLDIQE